METYGAIDEMEQLRRSLGVSSLSHIFDNFDVLPGTERALAAFKDLAEGEANPLLLCYGGIGNGKTHLLEALAIRLRERGLFCRYYTWASIISTLKSQLRQQNSTPGFDELLERYCRCPVLLVDDIGMGGSGSEWEYGILEEIINHRYRYQLTTAIVTNKDLDELPDRVVSRFRDPEVGVIVLNEGKDYRKQ